MLAAVAAVQVRREPLAVALVTIGPLADPVATTTVLLWARELLGVLAVLEVVRRRAAIVSLRVGVQANGVIDHHEGLAPMAPVVRCEAAPHGAIVRIALVARIAPIGPSAPTVRIETVPIALVVRDRTRLGARTGARRLVPIELADPTGASVVIVPFEATAARIDPIAALAPNAAIGRIAATAPNAATVRIDSIGQIAVIDHAAPAAGEKTAMPGSRAVLDPNAVVKPNVVTGPIAVTGPIVLPVPEVAPVGRRQRAAVGAERRARARAVVQAPRHGPVVTENGLLGRVAS